MDNAVRRTVRDPELRRDRRAGRAGARDHRQHDGHLQFRPGRVRAAWRLHHLSRAQLRACRSGSAWWPRRSWSARSGFVLERLIIRRFYAAPIVAMLGTYALGLIIREMRARPDRRPLSVGAGAARRLDQYRHAAFLGLALRHHRHHGAGDGRQLSAAGAHLASACAIRASLENPALARASAFRPTRSMAPPLRSAPRSRALPAR